MRPTQISVRKINIYIYTTFRAKIEPTELKGPPPNSQPLYNLTAPPVLGKSIWYVPANNTGIVPDTGTIAYSTDTGTTAVEYRTVSNTKRYGRGSLSAVGFCGGSWSLAHE